MYLRVERLSDIATNDGLRIQSRYFYGTKRNPYTNKSWPNQKCPSMQSWKEWREAMMTFLDANKRLLVPLHKWLKIDCSPKLWFNAQGGTVHRYIQCRWYESPLIMRRTSLEIIYEWRTGKKPMEYIPLLEIYPKQNFPNNSEGTKTVKTWEQRTKDSWNTYKSHLCYKKAVSKYPVMDFTCATSLWIVSDGDLFKYHGYYG